VIGPTCERAFLTRTTVYRAREICIGIVSADVVLAGTDFGGARLRFARDSPLEESGFEPSVPLLRKFLPGCCRREIPERLAGVPY
jgi:hypothetical protein